MRVAILALSMVSNDSTPWFPSWDLQNSQSQNHDDGGFGLFSHFDAPKHRYR